MNQEAVKETIEERKKKAMDSLTDSLDQKKLSSEEFDMLEEYISNIENDREMMVAENMVTDYSKAEPEGSDSSNGKGKDKQQDSQNISRAVFSSRTSSGPLKSESQFVSICGSTEIKVRKEDLCGQQTNLKVVSFLGGNTIFVEKGIRVVNRVAVILGAYSDDNKINEHAKDSDPQLIISGSAFLGKVAVKLL